MLFIITYLSISSFIIHKTSSIHTIPSKSMHTNYSNYTDKRTGIVYTSVTTNTNTNKPNDKTKPPQTQNHLDAFIPESFLKNYFGKGKS